MAPPWKNKEWCKSMQLRLDYTNIMDDAVGTQHGISRNDFDYIAEVGKKAYENLYHKRETGEIGFMSLPFRSADLHEVQKMARDLRSEFESFVVIGIGGSALGNIALQSALNVPLYNEIPAQKRNGGLKIYVPDNIDPSLIQGVLNVVDLKKTVFNVITKSGSTSETLANFLVIRNALIEAVGEHNYRNHIVITTDPEKGLLRKLAKKEGFRSLEIPQNVGGRFSVLTPVGLLSAAVANIDIEQLLAGAAYMDKTCVASSVFENPACLSAAIQYIMYQKGKHISVMMPYAQQLKDIADWFRQLWAESLGKKLNRSGFTVNTGPTPVKALGVTDQHSQIQLYIEGPHDKIIVFITVERFGEEVVMPHAYPDEEALSYLGDRTLNELLSAEYKATEYALTKKNRPNCKIILQEINPFTIGQLIYMLELQTAFAGELFNIDAFNQPGVEDGKKATYTLMNRKGYELMRNGLLQDMQNQERHIV
ncbi:glucose-6-phosphate isomerase [candidate division KSB1 bacterium]